MSVPVIHFDQRKADDAFQVHRALLMAERSQPDLSTNPQWQLLRMDAFERFSESFEVQR